MTFREWQERQAAIKAQRVRWGEVTFPKDPKLERWLDAQERRRERFDRESLFHDEDRKENDRLARVMKDRGRLPNLDDYDNAPSDDEPLEDAGAL